MVAVGYWVSLAIITYVGFLSAVSLWKMRNYLWTSFLVLCILLDLILGSLLVQRSPYSDLALDQILVYVQRASLWLIPVPMALLAYCLMLLYNGSLREERIALTYPVTKTLLLVAWISDLVFKPVPKAENGEHKTNC